MEMPSTAGAPRVLIVEDDTSLLRLLELRLTVDGYATRTAADGVVALQVLASWLPDVILTDVMMPRLSGLSLCRAVRRDPRTTTLPIILLTARCFDNDMQEVVDLGGVTFMNKPFDADTLNDALVAAVGGRPSPTGVGAPHAA
ncbi:MAG: response regulator [Candidatus Dormibacteraeota bacterium]|nr:response regulator [Candidatus Dormibacteraeota bacterium]